MKKTAIALFASLLLAINPALAASGTVGYTPGSGTNFQVTTTGGNDIGNQVLVDPTTPTQQLGITTNSAAKTEGVGTAGTPAGGVASVQGASGGTPLPAALNATPSIANGNGVVPTQSGIALSAGNPSFAALSIGGTLDSATNGIYANVLQGNVALSATNGVFANLLQGNAALTTGNPIFAQMTTGSAIIGKAGIDQTTVGTTNGVSLAQIGTGTVATSATGVQKVGIVGNAGSTVDAAIGGATAPTDALVAGLIVNTTPLTPSNGQAVALQGDANGYLNVHIQAGAGSGGTASSFGSAYPATGTAAGAEYLSSPPSLTSGQMVALQTTVAGSLHTTVDNTNANGSATSANSSPVVIASDQAAVAVKAASGAFASGSIASGALASGSIASGAAVSGAFVAGAIADLAHGQGAMAASVPVAIASNQSAIPVTPATSDPCTAAAKTNIAISTATGTTQLVAPSGSTQVYICSIFTIGATASIQNLVGGTGATCTTGTPVAVAGSTTAANGMSFAANGGFTFGNGGGTVMRTTTAGHGVCLIQSATAQISGNITYVQQ